MAIISTLVFYQPHIDIYLLIQNLPDYVINYNINIEFFPCRVEIDIPVDQEQSLLNTVQHYIINPASLCVPTKIIHVDCPPKFDIQDLLEEYNPYNYEHHDNILRLETFL